MAGTHKIRTCSIANLISNQEYSVSASSSTVIGRSQFSSPIVVKTLQSQPKCKPTLAENSLIIGTNSISFIWEPSLNSSRTNPYWVNCLSGELRTFVLYELRNNANNTQVVIYSGIENSFNLLDLNASTKYSFILKMCNWVGCVSTDVIDIETIDPPPNKWLSRTRPKYI